MPYELDNLPADVVTFFADRHLASLTTHFPDGSLQATPVGVTYEPEAQLARVITWASSFKARNIARSPGQQVAVCQIDGGRWLTLYGTATVTDDAARVAEAVRRYTLRYREPKQRDDRVVIEIAVTRLIGRV